MSFAINPYNGGSTTEKVASSALRRLFTRLMRDTAAGNVRWHGTNPAAVKSMLADRQFLPSSAGPIVGLKTLSKHAPLAHYTRGANIGLMRNTPAYISGGQSHYHVANKNIYPAQPRLTGRDVASAQPYVAAQGPSRPIALEPREGVLRYALKTKDPVLNQQLKQHGARLIPEDIFKQMYAHNVRGTPLSKYFRRSPSARGSTIVDRNAMLRHLAMIAPKSPNLAQPASKLPAAAAGKSNSIMTWLQNLLRNFFARKQK